MQLGEQQQPRRQLLEEGHALQLGEQQQLRRQLNVEAGEQHDAFGLLLPGLQCMQRMRTRCTCLERTSCGGGNRVSRDLLIFALVLGGTHRSCVSHWRSCISTCIHTSHNKRYTQNPQRHLHSSPACMSLEVVMKPWWSFSLPVCIAVALCAANNGLGNHSHVQFGGTCVSQELLNWAPQGRPFLSAQRSNAEQEW